MAVETERILEMYSNAPEPYEPLADYPGDPNVLFAESLQQGTLLAGREKPFCWESDRFTSEAALHRYRAQVEIEALINLAERGPTQIEISEEEKVVLRSIYDPDAFDARAVQIRDHGVYEKDPASDKWKLAKEPKPQEHDVKSVELYCGQQLDEYGLGHLKRWLHFGMTSEDTNNLAYNLMLRDTMNHALLPAVDRVAQRLAFFSVQDTELSTLGKTHAQKASPTTVGKQYGYHLDGIREILTELPDFRLSGKFSGAVGNHNPMPILFPDFDYDDYAREFVESFGFEYSSIENQRNNHLSVSKLMTTFLLLCSKGKDIVTNTWLQINDGNLRQRLVEGEAGSSTMAHKINPWRLELVESLFEQAITLVSRSVEGYIESRHERDLSDHDWERAYGDIFGRVVAAFNYLSVQLDRLEVDQEAAERSLAGAPEVLSELLQNAGRVEGVAGAYNIVKQQTQGRELSIEDIAEIATSLLPKGDRRDRVVATRPEDYIGIAPQKAREAVLGWHAVNIILQRGVLDESRSIDTILFDFDNTLQLGDKDELLARLDAIATKLGCDFTEDEIREIGDRSDYREMRTDMVSRHNSRYADKPVTEEMFQAHNVVVSGTFDDRFYLRPGAVAAIESLRASGKQLGLVTTRGSNSLPRLLKRHQLTDSFDAIVNRDDVTHRKPHPQPLITALGKLGVSNEHYHRVLMVGDSQVDDVGAGRAIGAKTALINDQELDPHGPLPTFHWADLEPLARRYGR